MPYRKYKLIFLQFIQHSLIHRILDSIHTCSQFVSVMCMIVHVKNVQFIMILCLKKRFQNAQLLGISLCVLKVRAAGLKLSAWNKFGSFRPASMKVIELENKKYRV